ncbi:MAG: hypothetical protein RMJ98_05285 [Myxococcales bacterium]|nr:hypothetical protein [Polyangiaceae bacterium]MDW8248703.1 hypothetical protein [Myxococcales bacterium]
MSTQEKQALADGGSRFHGIQGQPYLDLAPYLDLGPLEEIHEEICLGLCEVEPEYTGGSLKWMGVCAPPVMDDPYLDYGFVIEGFDEEAFRRFVSLAENPRIFDPRRRHVYRFGDETPNPLTPAQARYLQYRHRVYFPWRVAYHLLENERWEDKHRGAGKGFRAEARQVFPKTVAYLETLPFQEIGRALIFGLEANDHAPLHRDTEPGSTEEVGHTITLCPLADKGFYLSPPDLSFRLEVKARAYWFNDMDYHGVEARPWFRYSIRVDGVFHDAFCRRLGLRG